MTRAAPAVRTRFALGLLPFVLSLQACGGSSGPAPVPADDPTGSTPDRSGNAPPNPGGPLAVVPDDGDGGSAPFGGRTDCLAAATDADGGLRFCYGASDRRLLAETAAGEPYWSFALPGENATNRIVNLVATDESLHVVARTVAADGTAGQETSSFELSGAFERTVAFGEGLELVGVGGGVDDPFVVRSVAGALILVGRRVGDDADGGELAAVRLDEIDGRTEASRLYGRATREATALAREDGIVLDVDGTRHRLDDATLEAGDLASRPAFGPSPPPIIGRDGYEAILREVIALVNATALDDREVDVRAVARLLSEGAIRNELDAIGLGLTRLPDDGTGDGAVGYSCDAGGSLRVRPYGGVPVYDVDADECLTSVERIDGAYTHNGVGREGFVSTLDAFGATFPDGSDFALSGTRRTRHDRVGFGSGFGWTDARFAESLPDGRLEVDDFRSTVEREDGVAFPRTRYLVDLPDGSRGAAVIRSLNGRLDASFTVSAPFTGGVPMSVTANLAYDEDHWTLEDNAGGYALADLAQPVIGRLGPTLRTIPVEAPPATLQWSSGTLDVVAADGSAMTLRPIADDPTRFEIVTGGETFVRDWGEGFRVRCSPALAVVEGC